MQIQQQNRPQEMWIKVLAKGVITIPKKYREKLRLKEGEVARARIVGSKLIIESREAADYRLYSKEEIEQMVKEDQLAEPLASRTKKYWSDLP